MELPRTIRGIAEVGMMNNDPNLRQRTEGFALRIITKNDEG